MAKAITIPAIEDVKEDLDKTIAFNLPERIDLPVESSVIEDVKETIKDVSTGSTEDTKEDTSLSTLRVSDIKEVTPMSSLKTTDLKETYNLNSLVIVDRKDHDIL